MDTYNFTTRRRIILTQALYALDRNSFDDENRDHLVTTTLQMSRYNKQETFNEDAEIIRDILHKISNIDEKILAFLQHPNIPSVVFAVLRVGTYEILYSKNNKHNVGSVIKDYLNVAHAFSHDEEIGFINKILDNIQKAEAEERSL